MTNILQVLRVSIYIPGSLDGPERPGLHKRIEILPEQMNIGPLIDEEIRSRSGKLLVTG
jgi:hypothetical protein